MVKLMSGATTAPRKIAYMPTSSPLKLDRVSAEQTRGRWRSNFWPASSSTSRKTNINILAGHAVKVLENVPCIPLQAVYLNSLRRRQCALEPQDDSHANDAPKSLDADTLKRFASLTTHTDTHKETGYNLALKLSDRQVYGADSSLYNMKWDSVMDELKEFRDYSEQRIRLFPDYLSEEDKKVIIDVAETIGLGYQTGEKNLAVYKFGLVDRQSHLRSSSTKEDMYVDVSDLAQHGKENFVARLRLRRMNSGSGIRRNMLWDVAQLSKNNEGITDPVSEGEGGVYAVQSRTSGQKLAIFKPSEEECFVREGLQPGEGAIREEVAYILDSRMNGFSGVPATAVARLSVSGTLQTKAGAIQRFMSSDKGSMEGFGMPFDLLKAEKFVPVDQVHKIGLLDVRMFNTDRHPGNILLIGDKAPYTMIPIDHGCILPSWFCLSEARFDWLEYPQCKVPFSNQSIEYVSKLDAEEDALALRRLGIREECIVTLKICTLFLKLAVNAGKTLFWIGKFMQRDGCFEHASKLECCILRACESISLPLSFVQNEHNEDKAAIPIGLLSRRPPPAMLENLEGILWEELQLE